MTATLKKAMTSLLFAGAAASSIALAPIAATDDPPCFNPDGTACEVVTPDGASGQLPGGVQGGASSDGTAAGSAPGGVFGEAGPDGAYGCVPVYGCRSFTP